MAAILSKGNDLIMSWWGVAQKVFTKALTSHIFLEHGVPTGNHTLIGAGEHAYFITT